MKIFASGIATAPEAQSTYRLITGHAVPHVLLSYMDIQPPRGLLDRVNKLGGMLRAANCVLLDSGAFTFRTLAQRGKGSTVSMDTYFDEYLQCVRTLHALGFIHYWIELDVSIVQGMEWVRRQRAKWLSERLGSGLITVWHAIDQTWDDWLELIEEAAQPGRSRYVAIEGHQPDAPRLPYVKFIEAAYKRGVRVHGFKLTSTRDLLNYPFYSTDSTTWLSGSKYGSKDFTLASIGVPTSGRKLSNYNASPLTVHHGPRSSASRAWYLAHQLETWIQSERHITEYWRQRGVDWEKYDENRERRSV